MFGFMNFNMRNFSKNSAAIINGALDKMHRGELEIDDVLDSDELVNDTKSSMSQLNNLFSDQKKVKDLLDYILKEPSDDDQKKGHKFPFLACEIICSENPSIIKNIFDENKNVEEDEEEEEEGKTKKKSEYDDIDLEIDENIGQKSYEEHILNKEEDIAVNDDKFKIEVEEDENNKKIEDIFNLEEHDSETNKKKEDEDDMVNIDMDKEIKVEVEESPFDKKEEIQDNQIEEVETIVSDTITQDNKDAEEDLKETVVNKRYENSEDEEIEKKQVENPFTDNIGEESDSEKDKLIKDFNILELNESQEKSEQTTGINTSESELKKEFVDVDHVEDIDTNLVEDLKENEKVSKDNSQSIPEKKVEDAEDEEIEEKIENQEQEDKEHKQEEDTHKTKQRKESANPEKFDTSILDYFFDFLNTDSQLNFVLAGYFAKVFGHFLNQRQPTVMKYILVTRPEILKLLTKHLNRKSIVECIYKILISYSEEIPNSLDTKISFLKMIIDAFNPDDEEIVTNICDLIIDLFSVRKMYVLFITNKSIFQMIFDFVLQNINNNSFKHLIKILIKTNENILKDFGANIVTPNFINNETQELFFNFTYNVSNLVSGINSYNSQEVVEEAVNPQTLSQQLLLIFNTLTQATEVILKNFVDQDNKENPYELETTFGISVKILGTKRLLEIEYIRTILEILINAYASSHLFTETLDLNIILDKIIESNFLKSALVSLIFLIF